MAPSLAVSAPNKQDLDLLCVNTIRTLSMDAVQQANSGHPGTPMAMAPVLYSLWQNFLFFDPEDPLWPNRDRFVLSMGHASMLLYSILHLCRVKAVDAEYEKLGDLSVKLDEIRRFRQLDSKCPGHPEYHWTSGAETTTGPLGQGVATSVGVAIAGRWIAQYFNRPGFELFNYRIYAMCGDGCMMEGVSGEAASLAGHLKLSNLCWIYDNNKITIEGNTALAFSEDVATRFIAYGWNVTRVGDANDQEMLARAFNTFLKTNDRNYGWPEEAKFHIPEGVIEHFREGIGARGEKARREWQKLFERYSQAHPERAPHLAKMQRRELPEGWDRDLPTFPPRPQGCGRTGLFGESLEHPCP